MPLYRLYWIILFDSIGCYWLKTIFLHKKKNYIFSLNQRIDLKKTQNDSVFTTVEPFPEDGNIEN